ncbi:uncharacterized protein LOC110987202 isoform X2 [Acanthaster planci]|uniref:Uncharacterized protein LOC110987202 isoform X2 n=1 Tax=Acanthaster planci TaxID=133434 RepID=A0A8B7ZIE5_ACAPL|nr:uncharacterized protein LOC110987202 isoform X2 [Acanthaster planci]
MQFAEVTSLKLLCLKQFSELVAEDRIHLHSLEEFPSRLLRDLVPVLSINDLARLHQILREKGIGVQQYWLKFYRQAFQEDRLARQCACHDSSLASLDWRQRLLEKRCEQELQKLGPSPSEGTEELDTLSLKILDILRNPLSTHGPLDDFFPSLLVLHSDILPYVQRNEEIMKILQKSLRELVLTDYLPKYESILQQFLEFLIHQGVLRKFTLKHPVCETGGHLFNIFKVCSGVLGEIMESGKRHVAVPCCRGECCNPYSSEPDLDGQSKLSTQDNSLFSQIDPLSSTNPASHRCQRTVDHCIQHLVLCDFSFSNQPDHMQMLEKLFGIWPGLRELEFVNFRKSGAWEITCIKVLSALIRGQRPTPPLQRLRIHGSSVNDGTLLWLGDLLLRSEFKMLELEGTNVLFNIRNTDSERFIQLGNRRLQKDVFAQLSVLDMKFHILISPHYLESALLQPDCTITVLNLEYCQLGTPKVDSLFIHAKNSQCLRELSVVRNGYSPHRSDYGPAGYSGLAQLMQSGHLTKLNLGGCGFALTGWAHATDFVEALRLNFSLHQLLLDANCLNS